MSFGFFGKKKEHEDAKQALEIKEATTKSPDVPIENPHKNEQTIGNQNNFSNPFAQQNQNNLNTVYLNQANSIPNNQKINENQQMNPFQENSSNINQSNNNTIDSNINTNNMMNPIQTSTNIPNSFETQNPNQMQNLNNIENSINPNNNQVSKEEIQEIVDETVEKIIEERWNKLVSSIEKVVKWKEKQEAQLNLVKEDLVNMRENLETVEKKIINKISSYDSNIMDVNSEIKALEKVFQKITPTLINNVNELSKITEDLKSVDDRKDLSSKKIE